MERGGDQEIFSLSYLQYRTVQQVGPHFDTATDSQFIFLERIWSKKAEKLHFLENSRPERWEQCGNAVPTRNLNITKRNLR